MIATRLAPSHTQQTRIHQLSRPITSSGGNSTSAGVAKSPSVMRSLRSPWMSIDTTESVTTTRCHCHAMSSVRDSPRASTPSTMKPSTQE
jgi:hypothetical protein